jgi:nicotinamidase/pyrazinamidase
VSTVFVDVDSQIDFLYPAGSLFVPGAERIVSNIAELNAFAAKRGIPVISTMDAHTENDPEFCTWPPHCVVGTTGQHKPAVTLLEKRVTVPNGPSLPETAGAQQILLEKQSIDCFTNPNLIPLLNRLGADHCVVYGVVTEICVKNAIFGLLKLGRHVELVTDAVKDLDTSASAEMLAQFGVAGGHLTTSAKLLGTWGRSPTCQ